MKFENSFAVKAPIEEVWSTLMDVERVAPCMPGAEVLERTGEDAYKVAVRVKLGPMSMLYRGQVEIVERDEAAHRAMMRARAMEARGQGSANAEIHMSLAEQADGTAATIDTDMQLSGRAAAMGRGVITDVAGTLIEEFASNLAQLLEPDSGAGTAETANAGSAGASNPGTVEQPAPGAAAETPPTPSGNHESPPAGGSQQSFPVGRIAAGVISKRLSDPRTLALTAAGFAGVFVAIGYAIGRGR